jgi:hypothetical protein
MKPWYHQSFLKGEKIPTVEKIIEIANDIEKDRIRCLFVLDYLTAGRMQEIVRFRGYDTLKVNGKKKKVFNGITRESIKEDDLNIVLEDGRKILLINLRNLKNKNRKRKEIPVPLDIKDNETLFKLMLPYLKTLKEGEELFPFSYKNAYKIFASELWNPHWTRHIRLTHLVTVYGYKESQLLRYAGWSDSRPAKHYVEMNWKDLLYT